MDPWTPFLNFVARSSRPSGTTCSSTCRCSCWRCSRLMVLGLTGSGRRTRPSTARACPAARSPPAPAGRRAPAGAVALAIRAADRRFLRPAQPGLPPARHVHQPLILCPRGGRRAGRRSPGWYRDAGPSGAHGTRRARRADRPGPAAIEPRNRPRASIFRVRQPWPFFAPIALMFLFAGLVFGPLLILAGLVMGVLAALGWYLDAGRRVPPGRGRTPCRAANTRSAKRAFPTHGLPRLHRHRGRSPSC